MDKELLLPDPEQQAQAARHPREDGSRSKRTYQGKGGQNGMNNDKKPSRKHDWTSTELHLIALCIQCIALAVQLGALAVILARQ